MGLLEDTIARADAVLENNGPLEEQNRLIGDYLLGYQKQVRDFSDASIDLSRLNPEAIDLDSVRSVRTMLMALKEKRDHELMVAGAGAAQASMSFTQTVTTTITYTQTIKQVNEMPADILTIDQKKELESLLKAVDESGTDESKIKKTGKVVADWLFDNAIQAVPKVMPYVTQAIQSAFGS